MPNITSLAEQIAQGGPSGAFQPQQQNNWLFEFPNISGTGSRQTLTLSLDAGFLPKSSNPEIEINGLNRKIYVAGPRKYEAGTLILKDYLDRDTAGEIQAWDRAVYTPSQNFPGGTVGLPGNGSISAGYKRQCSILLFGPDGSMERHWTLAGCWPSSVDYGSLDMKSAEVVFITLTIRYDEAFYTPRQA